MCSRRLLLWCAPFFFFGASAARLDAADDDQKSVTFNDIAPILQARCQECHRPGDVAPFSLVTYQQARPWAKSIREQVSRRAMPPWFADGAVRPLEGDPSLTEDEVERIVQWVDGGALEGDPADAPPPIVISSDYRFGTPDLDLKMDVEFPVQPGEDLHRCFLLPDSYIGQPKFLTAAEIVPGNRRIVHHAVAYLVDTAKARKKDADSPGPGWDCFTGTEVDGGEAAMIAAYAPGNAPVQYTQAFRPYIPPGFSVVLAMHYHPLEQTETDSTRIGVYLTDETPDRLLHVHGLSAKQFKLPAGDEDVPVFASYRLEQSIKLLAMLPHMHYLGKGQTITAQFPDGRKETILRLNGWDIDWQLLYRFREPVALPAGTVLRCEGHFDNSAENPANPTIPPVDVVWGEESTDEMMDTYFFFTIDQEVVSPSLLQARASTLSGFDAVSEPGPSRKNAPRRIPAANPQPQQVPPAFAHVENRLLGEITRSIAEGKTEAAINAQMKLGTLYFNLGMGDRMEAQYKDAYGRALRHYGLRHEITAQLIAGMADAHRLGGRQEEAETRYREAIKLLEEMGSEAEPALAEICNNYGLMLFLQERHEEAEALYLRSLEINRSRKADATPVLNNLSFFYRSLGQFAEAEDYALQMIEAAKAASGPQAAPVAISHANLAGLYRVQKKYASAESNYRQALSVWQSSGNVMHPQAASVLQELAFVLHQMGRDEEANKAITLARSILSSAARKNP